jgi:ABC-type antimicrobial peptide transport system permease subunit
VVGTFTSNGDAHESELIAVLGVAASSVIGFIGGIFPAIRAARLPIANALRAV